MKEYQLKKGRLLVEGEQLTIEDDVVQRWRKNLLLGLLMVLICAAILYGRILYKPVDKFRLYSGIILLVIYSIYTIDFIIKRIVKFSKATEVNMSDIVKHERIPGLYKESGECKLTLRDGKTRNFILKQESDAKELVYYLNQHTNTAH